jgi:predicted DNA-binding transcriptional regulator YafY
MKTVIKQLNIKDIDNISVTAYRILSILNLLLNGPVSDQEINEKLKEDILGARSLSQDTIYIYMNTLRSIGCEISRPSKNTDYKYVMKNNPFKIKLNEQEASTIVKVRKYANTHDNWKLNLKFDIIHKLLSDKYLQNESLKMIEQVEKSILQKHKLNVKYNLIKSIEKYCNKKWTLLINYNSPISGEKLIQISAEKICFENGAYYLWGYNLDLNETQYLRVDRISEIKGINIKNDPEVSKAYTVIFKLTGSSALIYSPRIGESIVKRNNNETIIELKNNSKFKILQNILSFGSDCTVISPEEIKNEVVLKLKSAYNVYKERKSF